MDGEVISTTWQLNQTTVKEELVNAAVSAIKSEDIQKIHCLVKRDNLIAQQFWEACSFEHLPAHCPS